MQRILLAIDAVDPDKNVLEFACYLGKLTKSRITGVFLENMFSEERPLLEQSRQVPFSDWGTHEFEAERNAKRELVEKNIQLFKNRCINEETRYFIHRDRGVPAGELIDESRFADCIIMDAGTCFSNELEGRPSRFVKNVLHQSECPIVIAPESFEEISELVFAYDGSASSVFAMKQFTYLFPQFSNKKLTVLQANESGTWEDSNKHNFSQWLNEHFEDPHFLALKGDAETSFLDYMIRKKNIFLVMGAYGRSAISEYFKHSLAEILIKTTSIPIFIAHL